MVNDRSHVRLTQETQAIRDDANAERSTTSRPNWLKTRHMRGCRTRCVAVGVHVRRGRSARASRWCDVAPRWVRTCAPRVQRWVAVGAHVRSEDATLRHGGCARALRGRNPEKPSNSATPAYFATYKIPTIVAVRKFASVPASIARRPSRARSPRRDGASEPMPPIWMAIEEKFAKPQSA